MSGYEYEAIAVGGTFDHVHKGHRALISRAFEKGRKVYVGVTSDEFLRASGKKVSRDYTERRARLISYIDSRYPGRDYEVTKLEKSFGPGMFTSGIEAIAVSTETAPRVAAANEARRKLGLTDLKIEIVPMVMAEDKDRISSTRIRSGEIDSDGNVVMGQGRV